MQHVVFETKEEYYKWLSTEAEPISDTVDILLEYIAQLIRENESLTEYKDMYEGLCE